MKSLSRKSIENGHPAERDAPVITLLGLHGPSNPFPPSDLVFTFCSGVANLNSIQSEIVYSPNASFIFLFFSLLALFHVKLSWQALLI